LNQAKISKESPETAMETPQVKRTQSRLEDIPTDWDIVRDPALFVLRYAPAIQRYVRALVRNRHDAEEVVQEFFLRVTQHGLFRPSRGGRFRDYLKAAVRNAALNCLRRNRAPKSIDFSILQDSIADKTHATADQVWTAEWRKCLLERAWQALKEHQDQSHGNLFQTVLNMLIDNPLEDSKTLAVRTSALIGRPLRAEAFRQQVSRARRLLAKLIVREVAQTLDEPTPKQIKDELIALDLWDRIRDHLTSERRIRQMTASASATPNTSS
jgi:RNA polymerase sigma factor (sigma-70 family)